MNFKKFEISGNTKQEKRSGKNLYNVKDASNTSGGTTSVDKDDFITKSRDNTAGTSIQYSNYFTRKNNNLKTNTKYYFVLEIKEATNKTSFTFNQAESGESVSQFTENIYVHDMKNGDIYKFTLTTKESFEQSNYMLRTFISTQASNSNSVKFRISMFEKEADMNNFVYEAYGKMPSTSFKSEIRGCGDNVNEVNIEDFSLTGGTTTHQGKNFVYNLKADTYTLQRKFEKSSNAASSAGMIQIFIDDVFYKNINPAEKFGIIELVKDSKVNFSFKLSTSYVSETESSIKFYDIKLEKRKSSNGI